MSLKKESLFYDIFNLSRPWEIIIMSLSKQQLYIDFKFDYRSGVVNCPVCGSRAEVISKTAFRWKYLDLFEYSTWITAYVPTVDSHNSSCRGSSDKTLVSNILLLDLIVMQQKNTGITTPLRYLINAVSTAQSQLGRTSPHAEPTACLKQYQATS